MKKLSGFTRDFGQKEVIISHKRSIHSVLVGNIIFPKFNFSMFSPCNSVL